ncbi:MAG: TlpA family protein disulfide reductase [Candidatus Rokuibacteriota bacterium]
MSRKTAAVVTGLVLVAALTVLWVVTRPASTERVGAGGVAIGELMRDLGIVPVTGAAKPFVLESLDGRKIALADLAGRPALIYFWATW